MLTLLAIPPFCTGIWYTESFFVQNGRAIKGPKLSCGKCPFPKQIVKKQQQKNNTIKHVIKIHLFNAYF